MQADEDVGKIALAVPVLVSKPLELFLQDLCDRTYDITLRRGAKTMNSVHLKHCVQSYNVFDFLRDIVSKVPDYGHGHGHAHQDPASDDRVVSRRRKAVGDDGNETDDEAKRSRMSETGHTSGSRGRGRGRGRGRVRGARNMERETIRGEIESDSGSALQPVVTGTAANQEVIGDHKTESKNPAEETSTVADCSNQGAQPFDLNARSAENEANSAGNTVVASAATDEEAPPMEAKDELHPGWSISEVDKMEIDPLHLANLNNKMNEDDEDYNEEG